MVFSDLCMIYCVIDYMLQTRDVWYKNKYQKLPVDALK